jgi:hypothetical protein
LIVKSYPLNLPKSTPIKDAILRPDFLSGLRMTGKRKVNSKKAFTRIEIDNKYFPSPLTGEGWGEGETFCPPSP